MGDAFEPILTAFKEVFHIFTYFLEIGHMRGTYIALFTIACVSAVLLSKFYGNPSTGISDNVRKR